MHRCRCGWRSRKSSLTSMSKCTFLRRRPLSLPMPSIKSGLAVTITRTFPFHLSSPLCLVCLPFVLSLSPCTSLEPARHISPFSHRFTTLSFQHLFSSACPISRTPSRTSTWKKTKPCQTSTCNHQHRLKAVHLFNYSSEPLLLLQHRIHCRPTIVSDLYDLKPTNTC